MIVVAISIIIYLFIHGRGGDKYVRWEGGGMGKKTNHTVLCCENVRGGV
jgi:hypothetical protein